MRAAFIRIAYRPVARVRSCHVGLPSSNPFSTSVAGDWNQFSCIPSECPTHWAENCKGVQCLPEKSVFWSICSTWNWFLDSVPLEPSSLHYFQNCWQTKKSIIGPSLIAATSTLAGSHQLAHFQKCRKGKILPKDTGPNPSFYKAHLRVFNSHSEHKGPRF